MQSVDPVAVQFDRELDEIRIPLDDALDGERLGEVHRVVLQFEGDLRAARQLGGRLQVEAPRALAGPFPARLSGFAGAGQDGDLLGGHESGVKPDAELANEFGVRTLGFGQLLQEGLGAGMGDGPEVLDQFGPRHAHPGVGDGQGLGGFVRLDRDAQRDLRLMDCFGPGSLQEAQPLAGIRGIRHQLPG